MAAILVHQGIEGLTYGRSNSPLMGEPFALSTLACAASTTALFRVMRVPRNAKGPEAHTSGPCHV